MGHQHRAMMVEVLHALGVEVVVLGNHEFDFGAPLTQELLSAARFVQLGSNVRLADSGALFPGVKDIVVLPLENGVKIGVFGVCTTETGRDPFAGKTVRFEDEILHARRCVSLLQTEHKVNAVVAITHLDIEEDQRLARQVPGINAILGGHDHAPYSLFAGSTFIHKSGKDALWLGQIDMRLDFNPRSHTNPMEITLHWSMLANRGYQADPVCQAILDTYLEKVEREDEAEGKLISLGISKTSLDGTAMGCRQGESNLGNLIADSLRCEMEADVGILNAGAIKGDALHPAGLHITRKWLERYLPLLHPTVVVQMRAGDLKDALVHWMRQYPSLSSSFPQVSGINIEVDTEPNGGVSIRSLRFVDKKLNNYDGNWVIKVAVPKLPKASEWKRFERATILRTGPIVRDVVAAYVLKHTEIDYPVPEGRIRILES